MGKKLCICSLLALSLCLFNPVCATPVTVNTHVDSPNSSNSMITPYFDVSLGHVGTWTIDGSINYKYNGDQTWQYYDSGSFVALYRDYWGFRTVLTHVTSYNFNGNVDIVA